MSTNATGATFIVYNLNNNNNTIDGTMLNIIITILRYFIIQLNILFTIISVICVIFGLYLVILLIAKQKNFKKLTYELGYPVPKLPNLLFGHIDEYTLRDKEWEWHKRFGKVLGFYNCDTPQIRVSDLDLINEIFLKQNKLFNARTWAEYRTMVISKSILFNKGSKWKKSRKLIQPAMAAYRIKQDESASTIKDINCGIEKLIEHFKCLLNFEDANKTMVRDVGHSEYYKKGYAPVEDSSSPTGWSLDLNAYEVMQAITLDVIFRLGFNMDTVDVTKGSEEPSLQLVRTWMRAIDSPIFKFALAIPLTRLAVVPYMLLFHTEFKTYRNFMNGLLGLNRKRWGNSKMNSGDETNANKNSANDNSSDTTATDQDGFQGKSEPRRIYHVLLDEYRSGAMRHSEVVCKCNPMTPSSMTESKF